ncbi:MAG: hypothetical protein ABFC98_05700 [Candidatus Cloacimonas sp.]
MIFKKESDTGKIKEFLSLVENLKVELKHYKKPVLVWAVQAGTVYYSFWEEELLLRYGLENVDGWDYEEDLLFCPDWVEDSEDEDIDDSDLDEDDIAEINRFCHLNLDDKDK